MPTPKTRKATNRRGQTPKNRKGGKVVKSGNPDYVAGMQGLRQSNAAAPHKLKTAYVRKGKYGQIPGVE